MKNEKIIVIGASGLIGNYLFENLKNLKKPVLGTYNNNPKDGLIPFDITSSEINDLYPKDSKYVIFCSAITKIDECRKNPEYSKEVNVNSIKKRIEQLYEIGLIPVFISGAVVFDGDGDYKEDDFRNPANEYGVQKKEVENFIIKNIPNYIIVRLGKVFGLKKNEGFFADIFLKYLNNEEIPCIYDEDLSMTCTEDVAKGIISLLDKNKMGIFHLDSGIHKSRFHFALNFFKKLNINDAKIKKVSVKDFNFLDKRAKNQFLNASKFIHEIDFKFNSIENYYLRIFKNLNN